MFCAGAGSGDLVGDYGASFVLQLASACWSATRPAGAYEVSVRLHYEAEESLENHELMVSALAWAPHEYGGCPVVES